MDELQRTAHLTRQLSLIPMDTLGVKVNIVGCGAIGSFLTLSLAKMGITRIEVWDFDEVSIENMSNQFFRFSDIGTNKAVALSNLVFDFTNVRIKANPTKLESAAGITDILIVAVDSMAARRQIFESIADTPNVVKLVIDPRMSAEFYQQYTIDPRRKADADMYAKTLFTDNEAVATACTAKSTVYTATLAAGMVVKTVKNWLLKEDYPRNVQWNIKQSNQGAMDMYAGNAVAPMQGHTAASAPYRSLITMEQIIPTGAITVPF